MGFHGAAWGVKLVLFVLYLGGLSLNYFELATSNVFLYNVPYR